MLIPCPSPERVAELARAPENWRSAEDAADSEGIHRDTMYRWLASGLYVYERRGPGQHGRVLVLVDERGLLVRDPAAKVPVQAEPAQTVKAKAKKAQKGKGRGRRVRGKR